MDFRCARSSRLRSTSHSRFEQSLNTSDWCLKHWDIALSLVMQTIFLCSDVFSRHDQTPFLAISVHDIWVSGVISSGRSYEAETVTVYKRTSSRYINPANLLPRVSHHSPHPHLIQSPDNKSRQLLTQDTCTTQKQLQHHNEQCRLTRHTSLLQQRLRLRSLHLPSSLQRPVSSRRLPRTVLGLRDSVPLLKSQLLVGRTTLLPETRTTRLPPTRTTRAPVRALARTSRLHPARTTRSRIIRAHITPQSTTTLRR